MDGGAHGASAELEGHHPTTLRAASASSWEWSAGSLTTLGLPADTGRGLQARRCWTTARTPEERWLRG